MMRRFGTIYNIVLVYRFKTMNNNNELLEQCFRKARLTRHLSESSIIKYQSSIKRFFLVIGEKPFEKIEVKDFEEYTLLAREWGASNARIANVISAIKSVISIMQKYDMIARDLDLNKVEKPKIERKEVAYLSEHEIDVFFGCIAKEVVKSESVRNVRFMALMIFLLQTGARVGEALSINVSDINYQEKEVPIIGKGEKPRTLFLQDETLIWLKKYLAMRNSDHKALFVSLGGKSRWQQTDLGRSFRRFKRLSGLEKKFTIHVIRHTFATQHLNRQVPLNTVQFLLGHSSPMTTLKYYVGAVEKENAKRIVRDEHFNFIPKASIEGGGD